MKFRLTIRGALLTTTCFAVYSAIFALGYKGDPWGRGITFAVTCSFFVWLMAAIAVRLLMLIHGNRQEIFVDPLAASQNARSSTFPQQAVPIAPSLDEAQVSDLRHPNGSSLNDAGPSDESTGESANGEEE